MKLFHIYVLKLFLKYIFIVELFVIMMSVLSSSMGDSKMLAKYDYSFLAFAKLQFFAIVLNLNLAMPITTTVAAIVTILLLMRSNELLAYISLGGTIVSLIIPFATVGVVMSVSMMSLEYKVIPKVRIAREEALAVIRGNVYIRQTGYVNLWLMDGTNSLVNIELVDMLGGEISGIKEYIIDDEYKISKIITINKAVRQRGMWEVSGRLMTDISVNPPIVKPLPSERVYNKLWDNLMKVALSDSPRTLPPDQLAAISSVMKRMGMNVSKYDMLYYSKYANAVSVIVLLILTFPIAVNFSRNYSMIKNAILMFILGLFFWLFQAACYSLGESGTLSPIPANFLPTVLFIFISIAIIYKRERSR